MRSQIHRKAVVPIAHAMSDSPSPDPPLRGLNPAALVNIFGEGKRPRPIIPGWEIENILGKGGLCIVWRARRILDNAVADTSPSRTSSASSKAAHSKTACSSPWNSSTARAFPRPPAAGFEPARGRLPDFARADG